MQCHVQATCTGLAALLLLFLLVRGSIFVGRIVASLRAGKQW